MNIQLEGGPVSENTWFKVLTVYGPMAIFVAILVWYVNESDRRYSKQIEDIRAQCIESIDAQRKAADERIIAQRTVADNRLIDHRNSADTRIDLYLKMSSANFKLITDRTAANTRFYMKVLEKMNDELETISATQKAFSEQVMYLKPSQAKEFDRILQRAKQELKVEEEKD